MALALWFMSMDLVPWIMHRRDTSWSETGIGATRCLDGVRTRDDGLAWVVDVKRHSRADFGFWLHLFGLMAFWGGLTFAESSSEFGKAIYCLVNVGLDPAVGVPDAARLCGVRRHRRGDLSRPSRQRVFEDSLLFPFALSLIGLGIIGAGLALHRNRPKLSAWMADSLPAPLKRLRPPLAGGAARLEHAMSTIRLTMAQALVRFLAAQKTEIDGATLPLFGGVWAIFGHGNVAGMGEALLRRARHPADLPRP